ncbi:hypothetical protein EDD18DRAFT_379732 [Armillaria luteobubalina]|uniref:DUF6533 domain-containing protein n=1 Tax=Armillaria luteobubalina TaxID=153913 RepID=A0AA39ULB2_9AGAR|nr:hypothetical protein EDD18DRAFT_379732 [Armillaria luteobubalina]
MGNLKGCWQIYSCLIVSSPPRTIHHNTDSRLNLSLCGTAMDSDSTRDLFNLSVCRYAYVAGLTISIWDLCVTMDSEITHVWCRKWSLGKALFLLNRYIPPGILALEFYYAANHAPNNAGVSAESPSYYLDTINIILVAVTQVILALRTYALYLTNFWLYCLGCLIVFPTLAALFMTFWVYGKYI